MATPVVHVVDDDSSIRRALRRLLEARGQTVEQYASAAEFLERRPTGIGCVLLDLQMPEVSGLELLQRLTAPDQMLRVVILSGHADVATAVHAMKLGAVDLLAKPVDSDVLCATIDEACRRSEEAWEADAARRQIEQRFDVLSPREMEVAWMVSRGFLNKQVAYDLGIAERTVKVHRGNVMRKLDLQSVPELVRLLDGSMRQPPESVRRFLEAAMPPAPSGQDDARQK